VNAGTRLGAFALVLAAALGGGAALGTVAGPIDVGSDAGHDVHEAERPMHTELPAGGVLVSQNGYTLEPEDRRLDVGEFAFTITGPDGDPVTSFEELHDRDLHLIIASRDLQQYTHLHPVRDRAGRWTVDLPAFPGGAYRAFADFRPAGAERSTLGVDLVAPGQPPPAEPLRPRSTDSVDGFDVTLAGTASGGRSETTVTVRRGGAVVTTEPYLGAAGHLVALRDGDLAYLHVHPLGAEPAEPAGPVRFAVEVPSAGTYALFFDFKVDGEVHTAHFVVDTSDSHAHGGSPHGAPGE
jgi:hypothetical protein